MHKSHYAPEGTISEGGSLGFHTKVNLSYIVSIRHTTRRTATERQLVAANRARHLFFERWQPGIRFICSSPVKEVSLP